MEQIGIDFKGKKVAIKIDHNRRLTGALTDITGNKTSWRRLNELERLFSTVRKKNVSTK